MSNDQPMYADDAHRYELVSRIATGGMGEVWRAVDRTFDRPVAVKILKAEYADDPGFRARFDTEARHAASLMHPNIASVFDTGLSSPTANEPHPRPWLVMELVEGKPLSDLLRPGKPLEPEVVRDLMAQAGDALGAAHAAGIVHRDVKPANFLVTPQRQLKITDFGIARAADGLALTQTGAVMGTPQYLSPEQARGDQATPASDVYALAVVAFECLTGRRPFVKDTAVGTALAHIRDPIPELPASIPADLAKVVRRGMSKRPQTRFADGAAFAFALRNPDTVSSVLADDLTPTPSQGIAPAAPVTQALTLPKAHTHGARSMTEPESAAMAAAAWTIGILLALLIGLGVLFWSLSSDNTPGRTPPSDTPSAQPSQSSTGPTLIELVESDFVGRPVADVVADLEALKLQVVTEELPNPGEKPEGIVEGISPSGQVAEGTRITVSYWGAQPEPEPTVTTSTPPTPTDSPTTIIPLPSDSGSGLFRPASRPALQHNPKEDR